MSLDRSLRAANALVRHRNVLTRDERLAKLMEEEKWDESKGVLGMPKVAHRKMDTGKGGGKKEEAAAEGTATAAAPAAGGKAAPAAKSAPAGKAAAAAPAAGKAAAPKKK